MLLLLFQCLGSNQVGQFNHMIIIIDELDRIPIQTFRIVQEHPSLLLVEAEVLFRDINHHIINKKCLNHLVIPLRMAGVKIHVQLVVINRLLVNKIHETFYQPQRLSC